MVAERYGIELPAPARAALEDGSWESIKLGDRCFDNAIYTIVARPADALEAAAVRASSEGLVVRNLGDDLEGEARELAAAHARLARQPGVLISGGETTVTLSGSSGRGGRNCEYLLALALALDEAPNVHAIACDTDGIDGTEDAAGACIGPNTLRRARAVGLDARRMLRDHDSYEFFERLGDLIVTGPTRTNVNDFRAVLIE